VSCRCAKCRAQASPEGRRTAALVVAKLPAKRDNLHLLAIPLQRVCGQPFRAPRRRNFVAREEPCRETRRGRSTAGICRTELHPQAGNPGRFRAFVPKRHYMPTGSYATRAIRTLPTVFPSLRAHEPNPAGRAIHLDRAGEMLKTVLLRAGHYRGDARGKPWLPLS